MGNPASMTSTFMRTSWRAMTSFSSVFMDAPGDCSPSRRVVSKMAILRVMAGSFTLCVARRGHGMRRGSTQAHVLAEKKENTLREDPCQDAGRVGAKKD